MKERMAFFLDITLVSMIGLAQSASLIIFSGVKPNLILAVLVVLLFSEKEFWKYLILVLVSLICLDYSVFISKEVVLFGVIMLSAFYFKKYLSENTYLNFFLLTSILTAMLYLLVDYKFIFNNFGLFLWELFYNVLISLAFGFLYKGLNGKE
ncbi:MAG: hypothetical protein Q7S81_02510 [bacterium]|nr:hypothetical protein [bacterium]